MDIQLPEEYPSTIDVKNLLLTSVRGCVTSNMLKPLHEVLEPILGEKSLSFDSSIVFRDIDISGSMSLFKGKIPIMQFIGKLIDDDEILSQYIGDPTNCIANTASMSATRIRSAFALRDHVDVQHTIVDSALARRYLSRTGAILNSTEDGSLHIWWRIPYDDDTISGLLTAARLLPEVLPIYYKLLTRFSLCQVSTRDLPSFPTC